MRYSDESYNLRVEIDAKQFELSPDDARRLHDGLSPLDRLVEDLPVSDLYVTIFHHPRGSPEYQVKTALVLPAKTLFSSATDASLHPAFVKCVANLVQQVTAYKRTRDNADQRDKHRKGTYQEVVPSREPDAGRLEAAVRAGDYAQFRRAAYPYEESLRKRVGRWLGRYPEAEEKVGTDLAIADVVEAVFLNAFEGYEKRPGGVRLGRWLENLIDAAVKGLLQNPEAELEYISFARSLRDLAREQRRRQVKIADPGGSRMRTVPSEAGSGAGATPGQRLAVPRTAGTAHPAADGSAAYVIARKASEELDSPVFHAGDAGDEEAVALFTTREATQRYIDRAGWGQANEVGVLTPTDFVRWLLVAADQGVHWLVVDPDRDRHLAGEPQTVLGITDELAEFARSLIRDVASSSESAARRSASTDPSSLGGSGPVGNV
jgi:ribosome-associated translation inhibitor RaiA